MPADGLAWLVGRRLKYVPRVSNLSSPMRTDSHCPAHLHPAVMLLLMMVLSLLGLTGCSISLDDGPAEAIWLKEEQFGPRYTLTLVGTSKSGPVYRLEWTPSTTESPTAAQPVFATALHSCTVTEEDTLLTVVRRLFVGLEQIRVREREQRTIGTDAQNTISTDEQIDVSLVGIEALFDAQPIRICALSSIVDDCSVDLALWSIPETRPYEESQVSKICHVVRDYALRTESTFWSNSFFEELASQ